MTIGTAAVPSVVVAAAAAATLYWWAVFAATLGSLGVIGIDFQGPGIDWMVFHGAIRAVLDGQGGVLADGETFTALVNRTYAGWLTAPLHYCPWLNPPSFLVLLLPFGSLGFLSSYLLFQTLGAAALTAALWDIGRAGDRTVSLAVLLSPAAAVAVIEGQSALLVAALLIGGMRLVPTRPIWGGLLLGLMTFKPQFALLVPVALVAARQWRALGAAAAGGAGLVLASLALWGLEPWRSWIGQTIGGMLDPESKWTEYGRLWGDSVYASAVVAGLPREVASLAQALATVGSAIAVYALFASVRRGEPGSSACALPRSWRHPIPVSTTRSCSSRPDACPWRTGGLTPARSGPGSCPWRSGSRRSSPRRRFTRSGA